MDYTHNVLESIHARKFALASPLDGDKVFRELAISDFDVLAGMLVRSHKFDVSEIGATFDISLLMTAVEAAENGFLPVPFETCLFEFGDITEAALEARLAAGKAPERDPTRKTVLLVLSTDLGDSVRFEPLARTDGEWYTYPYTIHWIKGENRDRMFRIARRSCIVAATTEVSRKFDAPLIDAAQMVMRALVCMSTNHVVSKDYDAPAKLNKARERSGKVPMFSHTVVTIDQKTIEYSAEDGGSHASPRLHWRRGHIRTIASGKKVQVKPCLVGSPHRGIVDHDYKLHKMAAE